MIVCHCQKITDAEIHAAVEQMRAADPEVSITPSKLYSVLGKAADCGSCVSLFLATMRLNDNLKIPMHLLSLPAGVTQETLTCKATQKSSTISTGHSVAS